MGERNEVVGGMGREGEGRHGRELYCSLLFTFSCGFWQSVRLKCM